MSITSYAKVGMSFDDNCQVDNEDSSTEKEGYKVSWLREASQSIRIRRGYGNRPICPLNSLKKGFFYFLSHYLFYSLLQVMTTPLTLIRLEFSRGVCRSTPPIRQSN